MYNVVYAIFGTINWILQNIAVSDRMYDVFFNSRWVKENVMDSWNLTVDVNRSECHSTYDQLNFENTYVLILDAFVLAWQSRYLNVCCPCFEFKNGCIPCQISF